MAVNTRSRHPGTMIILLTCALENSLHRVNGFFNARKQKRHRQSEKATDH